MAQRNGQHLVATYLPQEMFEKFKAMVGERGMTPRVREMIAQALAERSTGQIDMAVLSRQPDTHPDIVGLLHDIRRATTALAEAFEPNAAFYRALERVVVQLIQERAY